MTDGGLGNIFDAVEPADEQRQAPRGPDFRVEVEIPRGSLGGSTGHAARVPAHSEIDGVVVPRKVGPGDAPDSVRLHLPADFQDGAVLRLRGQGGASAGDGRAGDLLVTVRVIEDPSTGRWLWLVVVALFIAAGGVWFFVRP